MSAYKKYMLARNAVMMTGGMFKTIILILFLLQVVSIIAYSMYIISKQTNCVGSLVSTSLKYWWFKNTNSSEANKIRVTLSLCDESIDVNLQQFKSFYEKNLWPYINERLEKILRFVKISCLIWLGLPLSIYYFLRRGRQLTDKIHIRGPRLVSVRELSKEIKKTYGEKTSLPLHSELKLPIDLENRMIAVVGTSGTGKSTNSLFPIVEKLLERQKKERSCVIVYGYKEYISEFYDPSEHILLNPLDARSIANRSTCWTLFNDIESAIDIEAVSSSIIPISKDEKSRFWDTAARQVLASGLYAAAYHNMKTNKQLWDIFTSPTEELVELMRDVPEAKLAMRHLYDPKSSRLANDVMAVLASYVMCFQYMSKADGDFSIKRFIDDGGVIFLNGNEAVQDTLRPYLSAVIDSLARTVLSLPTNTDRRIYFVVDEFQTLNPLPSVVKLLNARSVGFSAILGCHSKTQIDDLYGQKAKDIWNFVNTKVIYRINEIESAKYFSEMLGKREIQRLNESQGGGVNNFSDRFTLTQQITEEALILPAEITHMPDYECIIQLPGFDPCRVRHRHYKSYPRKSEHFVLRDDLAIDEIYKNTAKLQAVKNEIIERYELPGVDKKTKQIDKKIDPAIEFDGEIEI